MSDEISHKQRFWDKVTRERMSEVGSGSPFDVMVRGKYRPEKADVDSLVIGSGEVAVEADLASFDLEDRYFRLYDVDFSPPPVDIGTSVDVSRDQMLSSIVRDLEEDWGYEATSIPYDKETPTGGRRLIDGTVYWPESQEFSRSEVYEDFVNLVGEDILSKL